MRAEIRRRRQRCWDRRSGVEARSILVLRAEAEEEKRAETNEGTGVVGGGFPFGAKGRFKLGTEGEPERDGAAIAFFSGISVEGEEDREVV